MQAIISDFGEKSDTNAPTPPLGAATVPTLPIPQRRHEAHPVTIVSADSGRSDARAQRRCVQTDLLLRQDMSDRRSMTIVVDNLSERGVASLLLTRFIRYRREDTIIRKGS